MLSIDTTRPGLNRLAFRKLVGTLRIARRLLASDASGLAIIVCPVRWGWLYVVSHRLLLLLGLGGTLTADHRQAPGFRKVLRKLLALLTGLALPTVSNAAVHRDVSVHSVSSFKLYHKLFFNVKPC